jgi:UDP-glucose 4-epimerase
MDEDTQADGIARTYLVTGGAGFIGSHLTDALVARGDSVIVLDDLSAGSRQNLDGALRSGRAKLVRASAQDPELVDACMRRADACVHLAAALGVQNIVDNPLETLLANVRGADVVMAAAARHDCRLLFASSSEVYGKGAGDALTERDDCTIGAPSRSRWSYAIAKQFGESLAHAYAQCGRADMAAVRFFNIVGPRQSSAYGMVLPRFVGQALASEPLTIYGDGSQTRCFTSVHDAVRAVVGLLDCETAGGGTYNIGASRPIRIDDLAARVIERSHSRSQIVFVPYASAYGSGYEELGRRVPDTTALRDRTGWSALHTVDDMIEEVLAPLRPAAPARPHARTRRRTPAMVSVKR